MPKGTGHKWTDAEKAYLKDNFEVLTHAQIGEKLGMSGHQVKNAASRFGFTRDRSWPADKLQLLRDLYSDTRTKDLAKQLGCSMTATYGMAKKLGLKKSDAFNASEASGRMTKENRIRRGLAFRFPKGNIPANKGLRRPGYAPGRMAETQFKKGSKPANRREIGEERTSEEGYVYLKVGDGRKNANWRLKHWVVWEKANGREVPPGHIVHFRDRDKLNFDPDNLELVAKEEWINRHRVEVIYPEPIAKSIRALAGFKRRLNSYAKKQDRRSAEPALRDDGKADGR